MLCQIDELGKVAAEREIERPASTVRRLAFILEGLPKAASLHGVIPSVKEVRICSVDGVSKDGYQTSLRDNRCHARRGLDREEI